MKLNTVAAATALAVRTHEGGPAIPNRKPIDELKRLVMACFLWEDGFYVDGKSTADRIKELVPLAKPEEVGALAIEARENGKLRHVPLLLLRELARHGRMPAEVLTRVVKRVDEITEFLAIYQADNGAVGAKKLNKLSNQVRKGLAAAFLKFDEYQFAKYNRDGAVTLKDALFLCHPNPKKGKAPHGEGLDPVVDRAALFKKIVDGTLATPDTWEVALSAGKDKLETWNRLLDEGKLGSLALLRNLRNMQEAGVEKLKVANALLKDAPRTKALPFRYLAAARACPQWEDAIDAAMQVAMVGMDKLDGTTVLLVDVSGSMEAKLSSKSDLSRLDAAKGLAILLRAICAEGVILTFSNGVRAVPSRSGMALADAIGRPGGGTDMGAAVEYVKRNCRYDRLIVITDEQSRDAVHGPGLGKLGYIINVAANSNGVGYGNWVKINGFSESVVKFIQAYEAEEMTAAGV